MNRKPQIGGWGGFKSVPRDTRPRIGGNPRLTLNKLREGGFLNPMAQQGESRMMEEVFERRGKER